MGVIALAAAIAGGYVYRPALMALVHRSPSTQVAGANAAKSAPSTPALASNVHFAPALTLDLPAAIDQDLVQAEFIGNGREKMHLSVTNKRSQAVRLHLPAGMIFQNGNSSVVLLRSRDLDLKAGELKDADLQTAATSSPAKASRGFAGIRADRGARPQGKPAGERVCKICGSRRGRHALEI
jgi:hypothetical protein